MTGDTSVPLHRQFERADDFSRVALGRTRPTGSHDLGNASVSTPSTSVAVQSRPSTAVFGLPG